MNPTAIRLATAYYALIAALFAAGWIVFFTVPAARRATLADAHPDSVLYAFFLPDLVFFVAAPALAAFGVLRRCAWTAPVAWAHAAAVLYGSLWMWGAAIFESADAILPALAVTPLAPLAIAAALAARRAR